MQTETIRRAANAAKGHPYALIGMKNGERVCNIKLDRPMISALRNFVPRTILDVFRGREMTEKEAEAGMSAALRVVRILQDYECNDVRAARIGEHL